TADAITVGEGGTAAVLVGGATSVLANDTDADLPHDTLTVNRTPVVGPAYGTLTLNADGTFSYTHDGTENLTDSFTYEVSDAANHQAQAVVSITVTPVNDNNPVFTSSVTFSVVEDTTAVVMLTATDADLPAQTISFSVTGGVDAAQFEIVSGDLRFKTGPNFEHPTDAGADNVYLVNVTADDGAGGTTVQSLSVLVTAHTWQNSQLACDVSGDGLVTALDVLMLINEINFRGSRDLVAAQPPTPVGPPFLDPNGDLWLTPADVILVIDYINSAEPGPISGGTGGEGEQVGRLDMYAPALTGEADAAATILSAAIQSDGRRFSWGAESVDHRLSGESANIRAATTALAGGGLPCGSRDVAYAKPGIDLRSGPAATLPNAAQEFDLEAFELEEAISAIAGDIAGAWNL
ncbi:MAG: Ig-like domain-containing protein, partial [Planctomycetota bacterium]|nr:Ig-like domain-containing protein [Planctomycetota bacterium]